MFPDTLYALPDFFPPARTPHPPYSAIGLYFLTSKLIMSSGLMCFSFSCSGLNWKYKPSFLTLVTSFNLKTRKISSKGMIPVNMRTRSDAGCFSVASFATTPEITAYPQPAMDNMMMIKIQTCRNRCVSLKYALLMLFDFCSDFENPFL